MAFLDLIKHPWWTRASVVQEVVLARHVVVMCGNYITLWERILFRCIYIHRHFYDFQSQIRLYAVRLLRCVIIH